MSTIIAGRLRDAGHVVTLHEIPSGASLSESCTALVKQAAVEQGIVVAAGGDGTVNGIARLCYDHGATLAVIPLGTFNYFARAVDIPVILDEALETISTGRIRSVSAGFVENHLFLNNASFGLYPKLIRKREKATRRFGRKRIIGALSALHSLCEKHKTYAITIADDGGKTHEHRTSMVFIGNNTLQLQNLGLDVGECTKRDRLAVVILKPMTRLQTARVIWRGIVRNLNIEDKLIQYCSDGFEVMTERHTIPMVVDGEIVQCGDPVVFRVEANAIRVMVPQPAISKEA